MAYDATHTGTAGVTGKFNTAVDFDASDSCTGSGYNLSNIHDNSGTTISFWIEADSMTMNHKMVSTMTGSGSDAGIEVKWNGTVSHPKIKVATTDASNNWVTVTGSTTISAHTWTHILVTIDSQIKIYVNGTLDGTSSTFTGKSSTSTTELQLATQFDGAMDDFGLWHSILSSANISTLQTSDCSNVSGAIIHYKFEETGTTVTNHAGSSGGGSSGGGGGEGSSEGEAPTGDGIPQSERLQILSTVVPR